MHVLVLGPNLDRLVDILRFDDVTVLTERCGPAAVKSLAPDWIVSYGYRYLVPDEVLAAVGGAALNLHISLLPWNRGADPNFWSWVEHTPKGVSVHLMTAGLDRGELLGQREVDLHRSDTMRSSYDRLQAEVVSLFGSLWPALRTGQAAPSPQPPGGSYHRSRDKEPHLHVLRRGWETPCGELEDYGHAAGLWRQA